MNYLNAVIWSADPDLFVIPKLDHPIRWYGVLFAIGFILGQMIFQHIYKVEKKPLKDLELLLLYVVAGTVLGARLGHCLFYDPAYYLSHPLEILKVWEGGLASHGGGIGLFIALFLYARKKKDQPYLWLLDRMVIIVALAGACIRTGNFVNSEIIGKATGSSYGIVFARDFEEVLSTDGVEEVSFSKTSDQSSRTDLVPMEVQITYERGIKIDAAKLEAKYASYVPGLFARRGRLTDHIVLPSDGVAPRVSQKRNQFIVKFDVLGVARHPAQLYEAIYCIFLFLLLAHIWYHHRDKIGQGFLFGLFMSVLFALRFIDEFFKENQEAFEDSMALNMGQLLSIPFFLVGVFFLIRSFKNKKSES